ncbi:RNA degradosome polyphosphate kinase [Porphyromonas sp.]|uniref:RNA degradosome polyphosphate kinase n=1 Tax=Porphyromonas sp. TaxID=1924944 RepID=UPI0026DD0F39|nr:RNA degradosome polyphosphate kinase [Porphyromonas sp.]MDO4695283.1 RNA degradosome polyphosphate kinase [Porphyromonas sp.]MDO4770679.1 RNA degradosome polyphosphate kinase [Porphyromonas sp.]
MKTDLRECRPHFVDRDISWLYFNRRILFEAQRADIPLLERLNFLGIYSNNLDEFFRVRIALLRRTIDGYESGVTPSVRQETIERLRHIYKINAELNKMFEDTFSSLISALKSEGIMMIRETELLPGKLEDEVHNFYMTELNASTNPIFLRKIKSITDVLDESIYLAVELKEIDSSGNVLQEDIAIIRQPVEKFGRFIRLSDTSDGKVYIMFLDDVIRHNLKYIFVGKKYNSFRAYTFKFTKDSQMKIDEQDNDGVLQRISKGLSKRSKGDLLRVVFDKEMPKSMRDKLFKKAQLDRKDAKIPGGRYHNTKDLMDFPSCDRADLLYPVQQPIGEHSDDISQSIIDKILVKDRGLHFPYQSFDRFIRVLREAAISDDVKEIKVTLYRVARESNVVNALIAAARNGKKVTAVVELLARFDEASNILWSREMMANGIKVVFGPEKLKIHSKLVYISTKNGDIACVSTGNMHEGTAKVYTDYMLFTHDKRIVQEINKVFTFIEQPYLHVSFKNLLVAPNDMRNRFANLIHREIKNRRKGLNAYIKVKVNHITDPRIIKLLYKASEAGVKIELLVRGNCSIVPGVEGCSDNITVNGIIDRYLEHSRIFIFCNNDKPLYFIGSADWMERNLDRRIEVAAPVYDEDLKAELRMIVEKGLADNLQGHWVNTHGNMPRRKAKAKDIVHSQSELYKYYLKNQQLGE